MAAIVQEAERRYREYAPVIRYLEKEIYRLSTMSSVEFTQSIQLPQRLISRDYDTLTSTYKSLKALAALTSTITAPLAPELFLTDSNFEAYERTFSQCMYLEQLNEETIWNQYEGVILASNSSCEPFVGFGQEHRDVLMRLKFLSIDKRFRELPVGSHPAEQPAFRDSYSRLSLSEVYTTKMLPSTKTLPSLGDPDYVPSNQNIVELSQQIARMDEKIQLLSLISPKVDALQEQLEDRICEIEFWQQDIKAKS